MDDRLRIRQPEPEPMDRADEAQAYADADFADVNAAFVTRLLELAGPCEAAMALDLGTGPGDIPLRVLRECAAWRIAAADVSMPMLGHARRGALAGRQSHALYPICMDAKAMPFPTATFDVVFSNSIVHHITDVDCLWGEVKRVAKPGAVLFLRDLARPATHRDAEAIVRLYAGNESALLQEEYFRSLLSAYTPAEVRTQLDRAGLSMLRVEMVSDRHWDVFGQIG